MKPKNNHCQEKPINSVFNVIDFNRIKKTTSIVHSARADHKQPQRNYLIHTKIRLQNIRRSKATSVIFFDLLCFVYFLRRHDNVYYNTYVHIYNNIIWNEFDKCNIFAYCDFQTAKKNSKNNTNRRRLWVNDLLSKIAKCVLCIIFWIILNWLYNKLMYIYVYICICIVYVGRIHLCFWSRVLHIINWIIWFT